VNVFGVAHGRSRSNLWLSLLKNIFGVGIGRQMIAAETYSWAGQYIGDVCDRCGRPPLGRDFHRQKARNP
jgi:hypothetical protein